MGGWVGSQKVITFLDRYDPLKKKDFFKDVSRGGACESSKKI
jgi:hypothetical protein